MKQECAAQQRASIFKIVKAAADLHQVKHHARARKLLIIGSLVHTPTCILLPTVNGCTIAAIGYSTTIRNIMMTHFHISSWNTNGISELFQMESGSLEIHGKNVML